MSEKKQYNITCPSCRFQQDVELYESINVGADPALKQMLMENRLNRVECVNCDQSFRIDTPLLYNDPANNVLIHWLPAVGGVTQEQILEDFDQSMTELDKLLPADMVPPRVRLVFTRVELVELIFIIEAGMNERVVEYIKYSIYTRNAAKVSPEKFRLLLSVHDSTEEELCFAMQDVETQELSDLLRYGRPAYESLVEMYDSNAEEFFEMFPGPYVNARQLLLEESDEV